MLVNLTKLTRIQTWLSDFSFQATLSHVVENGHAVHQLEVGTCLGNPKGQHAWTDNGNGSSNTNNIDYLDIPIGPHIDVTYHAGNGPKYLA